MQPRGSHAGAFTHDGALTMAAASTLAAVLGSVHAFSVFLAPLEASFDASRAAVSLTYSLALVSLTLAVLLGHRIYARWRASTFVIGVTLIASAGALIAAFAPTLSVLWIGYGVLFGAANGLGYGFGLQIAAQTSHGREGLAMGIVTAAYALGAAVSPPLFAGALQWGGYQPAMLGLATALIIMGGTSAVLLFASDARFQEQSAQAPAPLPDKGAMVLLWLGYGAGVAGGLMAIGHAAGIVRSLSVAAADWTAPVVIALCNLAGSLISGRLVDRFTPARLLIGLPLISAAALPVVASSGQGAVVMVGLGVVGFAYGGVIAAYPAAISKLFGLMNGPRIYGLVFTAWGAAGLSAPWLAGQLYDWNGAYHTALATAALMGVLSSLCIGWFFHRR